MTPEERDEIVGLVGATFRLHLAPFLETITGGFADIAARLDSIESRLVRLEKRVERLEDEVARLRSDTQRLGADVQRLDRDVRHERAEDAEQIEMLKRRLTDLEKLVVALDAEVVALKKGAA